MRRRSDYAIYGVSPYSPPRIFYDDCEGILKWDIIEGGVQSQLIKSQTMVYEGDYSNQVRTGWSRVADEFITRVAATPATGTSLRLRIEIAWALKVMWYNNYFNCLLGVVLKDWYASVRLDYGFDDDTWVYWTVPADKYACPNGTQKLDVGVWNILRIDVDFNKRIYLGAWSNDQDLGISGKAVDYGEGEYAEYCAIWLFFKGGYKVYRFPLGWVYYPDYWHFDVVRVEEI